MSATQPDGIDEIAQLTRRRSAWKTAPLDALVLLASLTAANWFLAHGDPGFHRINPTPWVLLPFFLGGRYGAASGMLGTVLAAAAVLTLQWALGNMTPQALFTAKPYYFLSLLIAGAAGTVVYYLVAGPSDKLRRRALAIAEKNLRLEEDLAIYRANEAQLQEALLLNGAEAVTLPGELQRLLSGDRGRFDLDLLRLLERETGIIAAALYRNESGRPDGFSLSVHVGEASFPHRLPDSDSPLAAAALETGKIATWKADGENREEPPAPAQLAAIPWRRSPDATDGPRALLLISRMEFSQISWETFARIEAIFGWCLARVEVATLDEPVITAPPHELLSPEQFRKQIESAHYLEARWNLPGQLILFAPDSQATPDDYDQFVRKLCSLTSPADAIGRVSDDQNMASAIGLIVPAVSREAGEICARQWISRTEVPGGAIRSHVLPLAEAIRLTRSDSESAPAPGGDTKKETPRQTITQSHAAAPESATREPSAQTGESISPASSASAPD